MPRANYRRAPLPAEAIERQLKHILDHTLLILRFRLDSERRTVMVKEGVHWSFDKFMNHIEPVEFEEVVDNMDGAIDSALSYLKKKCPASFQTESGDAPLA